MTATPTPPRELEPLRRASIGVLTAFRVAAGGLGLGVIAFAAWHGWHTDQGTGAGVAWATLGASFGLPLLMPLSWQRRHWRVLLVPFLLLWLLPILGDPEPLAFILRMFATGVALSALIVWDLLLGLTRNAPVSPPSV